MKILVEQKGKVLIMAKFREKPKDSQLIVRVRLSISERLDEESLNSFLRKFIRGLLKTRIINRRKLEYSGPIGISLYDRLKKPISKYDFFFIIEQFVALYEKMEMADLDINKIVTDIKRIYINETTKEIQFIYLPLMYVSKQVNLLDIMYNIVYAANPMVGQDDSYISQFNYFLQGLNKFEPKAIEKYILKIDRKVVNIIKKHGIGKSGFMTDKPRDYYAHYDNESEEATGLLDEEDTGLLEDEEETGLLNEDTTLLEDEEATGLLNEDNTALLEDEEATGLLQESSYVSYAILFRILTNETIQINKPVFRIGKEKSYCDYFVNNNNAVSRSHADIITRGRQYFIMDLNSTNKTFVNGIPIIPRQEEELHEGDCIKLGNEEFVFHS